MVDDNKALSTLDRFSDIFMSETVDLNASTELVHWLFISTGSFDVFMAKVFRCMMFTNISPSIASNV